MLETTIKNLTTAVIELTTAIAGGNVAAPATPASETEPEATTTQSAPADVPEPAPTPAKVKAEAAPVTTEAPAVEAKVPTKKQLVEKFIELAQTKDREVAVKLLADFGVSKLPELTDKTKWAEFIAAAHVLLHG